MARRIQFALLTAVLAPALLAVCLASAVASERLLLAFRPPPAAFIVPNADLPQIFTYRPHTTPAMESGVAIGVNNFGMRRDQDITQVPAPDAYRILAYGDSITRGFGLPLNETWAAKLEHTLVQSTTRHPEVLIMLRGTSPSIYAFHIRENLPVFRPHLLLMEIELLNDVSDEALIDYVHVGSDGLPDMIRGGRYLSSWDGNRLIHTPVLGNVLQASWVMNWTSDRAGDLVNILHPNPLFAPDSKAYFYSVGPERPVLTDGRLDAAFIRMFDTIDKIRRLSESRGVPFVLAILPSQYVFEPGQYRDTSLALLRRAEAEASRLKLHFLSPMDAYAKAGGASLFQDFCHPNATGTGVLAGELARYLTIYLPR